MPEGKAVVARPSLPGLPPMPPSAMLITPNSLAFAVSWAGTRPWALFKPRIQMEPALSACTFPGSACARQPNTASASIWPMTWRAVTGEGLMGSTQVPGFGDEIEAGERADVVGHMGGDHRLEAEDGIGMGIGAGAVDAEDGGGG